MLVALTMTVAVVAALTQSVLVRGDLPTGALQLSDLCLSSPAWL